MGIDISLFHGAGEWKLIEFFLSIGRSKTVGR